MEHFLHDGGDRVPGESATGKITGNMLLLSLRIENLAGKFITMKLLFRKGAGVAFLLLFSDTVGQHGIDNRESYSFSPQLQPEQFSSGGFLKKFVVDI